MIDCQPPSEAEAHYPVPSACGRIEKVGPPSNEPPSAWRHRCAWLKVQNIAMVDETPESKDSRSPKGSEGVSGFTTRILEQLTVSAW